MNNSLNITVLANQINLIYLLNDINVNISRRRVLLKQKVRRNRKIAKFVTLYLLKKRNRNRSLWALEHKTKFWEEEIPNFSDKKFKTTFRLNRKTFSILVDELSHLNTIDTNMVKAIPVDKCIAIALYSLGSTSVEYETIANLFGIDRTIDELLTNFCKTVCDLMEQKYIFFPLNQEQVKRVVNGFEKLGFPQCMGVIDGCHIEVKPNIDEAGNYRNCKGWYSTVLLAVCDHQSRFTYVNVGRPGRQSDSQVFKNSLISKQLARNPIFEENSVNLHGIDVPVLLAGDAAFPLSEYIMKPFPYKLNQDRVQKIFNIKLSKCRRVIEIAFSELKGRFRRLLKPQKSSTSLLINACCILHNFCKDNQDEVFKTWIEELEKMQQLPQPTFFTNSGDNNYNGVDIRNAIAEYFNQRLSLM